MTRTFVVVVENMEEATTAKSFAQELYDNLVLEDGITVKVTEVDSFEDGQVGKEVDKAEVP